MAKIEFDLEILTPSRFAGNFLNSIRTSERIRQSAVFGMIENALGFDSLYTQKTKVDKLKIKTPIVRFGDIASIKITLAEDSRYSGQFSQFTTLKRTTRALEIYSGNRLKELSQDEMVFKDEKSDTKEKTFKKIAINISKKINSNTINSNYSLFIEPKGSNNLDLKADDSEVEFFLKMSPFIKRYRKANNSVDELKQIFFDWSKVLHVDYYRYASSLVYNMPDKFHIKIDWQDETIFSEDCVKKMLLNPQRPLGIGKKKAMIDITNVR